VTIPDPTIFEVGNSPSNDLSLPKIMKVRTVGDFRAEILANMKATSYTVRLAEFEMSIFQRTRTFNSWFWAINGAGNIFHRLCKYFDLCSATDIRTAAVLQPIIKSSRNLSEVGYMGLPKHHARAARDLMSCFGPLFWCVSFIQTR